MKRVALAFWVIVAAVAALLSLLVVGFAYLDVLLAVVTLGIALEVLITEIHHQNVRREWSKVRTDVALISQWMEETHAASQERMADTRLLRLDARRAALERRVTADLRATKDKLKGTEQKLLSLTRKVGPHLRHKIVRIRSSTAKGPVISVAVAPAKTADRRPKTVTITRPRTAKATVEVKVKAAKPKRTRTKVVVKVEPKPEPKPVRVQRSVVVSVPEESGKKTVEVRSRRGVTVKAGRGVEVAVGSKRRKRTKIVVRA